MDELDISQSRAALELITDLVGLAPQSPEVMAALKVLDNTILELAAWKKLKDPQILHANLLSGRPAKLSPASLLHLVGAGECSNAGGCQKKLSGDFAGCETPGHAESLVPAPQPQSPSPSVIKKPNVSALSEEECQSIALWLSSDEGRESMKKAFESAQEEIKEIDQGRYMDPTVWQTRIGK